MKRICLVVLALALLAIGGCTPPPAEEKPPAETVMPAPRQITKSGNITRDEIWSGTIRVTGDIWVDDDATLPATACNNPATACNMQ